MGGEARKSRKEEEEREGKEREEKTIISILWKYLQKEQAVHSTSDTEEYESENFKCEKVPR